MPTLKTRPTQFRQSGAPAWHRRSGVGVILWLLFAAASPITAQETRKATAERQATAEPKTLSEAELQALQKRLASAEHLSVDFKHKFYIKIRKRYRTNTGEAHFGRPNMFRWQIHSPPKREWLFDGKRLVNLQHEQKTATMYATGGSMSRDLREIVDMVLDLRALRQRYTDSPATQRGDRVFLTLKPRQGDKSGEIRQIDLEIDTKQLFIKRVMIHDNNPKPSIWDFSEPRKTKLTQAKRARFSFNARPGYRVQRIR